MLVVGLFAVLSWDSTFPDRRDVLVLAPLPIRARTLFLAKVAASGAALSITVAALNMGSGPHLADALHAHRFRPSGPAAVLCGLLDHGARGRRVHFLLRAGGAGTGRATAAAADSCGSRRSCRWRRSACSCACTFCSHRSRTPRLWRPRRINACWPPCRLTGSGDCSRR